MTQNLAEAKRPLRRVLIVWKKTAYQLEVLESADAHVAALLAEGNPSIAKLEKAHRDHLESLAAVTECVRERGIEFTSIDRTDLTSDIGDVDLIITVGGDGTFLGASHVVSDIPVLGVNSATGSSHGHWCLANKDNVGQVLDEIQAGSRAPLSLMRLEVVVNGETLPTPVLNEAFIAHPSPAGTSRFLLEVRGKREEMRSSGILVGPGVGSTGWVRSAGGAVLPATSRQFQFLVREPSVWPGESRDLLRGILETGDEVKFVPIMGEGKLFIDGQHLDHDIKRGDEVVVRVHPHDLLAYLSADVNAAYEPKSS